MGHHCLTISWRWLQYKWWWCKCMLAYRRVLHTPLQRGDGCLIQVTIIRGRCTNLHVHPSSLPHLLLHFPPRSSFLFLSSPPPPSLLLPTPSLLSPPFLFSSPPSLLLPSSSSSSPPLLFHPSSFPSSLLLLLLLTLHHQLDIVKMLLDAGANMDAQSVNGGTALMRAIETCQREIVKLLLEWG